MGRVKTDWTEELREQYRSGAHNQFLIHGNIADIYPPNPESEPVPLTQYLCEHLLNGFDLSLVYSLSKGLTVHKGGELLQKATRDFSGIDPAASMPPLGAIALPPSSTHPETSSVPPLQYQQVSWRVIRLSAFAFPSPCGLSQFAQISVPTLLVSLVLVAS